MLGRFLFRWRGVIGFVAFGVVFWLARPTFGSCLFGLPMVLAGLAIRFWASGYIGIAGRVREIGGQREERGVRREGREARSEERGGRREEDGGQRRRIVGGPYRILRHPLYIGNLLLVVGMLVAMRPTAWLAAVVVAGFMVEYTLIVVAEERELSSKWKVERGNGKGAEEEKDLSGRRCPKSDARCEMSEGPDESPESVGEKQGTVGLLRNPSHVTLSEVKGLLTLVESPSRRFFAALRMTRGGFFNSPTVPVFRCVPESFLLRRALVEWRTWVVTGAAWGLAVAKAFSVRS